MQLSWRIMWHAFGIKHACTHARTHIVMLNAYATYTNTYSPHIIWLNLTQMMETELINATQIYLLNGYWLCVMGFVYLLILYIIIFMNRYKAESTQNVRIETFSYILPLGSYLTMWSSQSTNSMTGSKRFVCFFSLFLLLAHMVAHSCTLLWNDVKFIQVSKWNFVQ